MAPVRILRLLIVAFVLVYAASAFGSVQAQDPTQTPEPTPTATATATATPIPDLEAFEIYPKGKMLGDFFDATIEPGKSGELVVVLANTGNVVFEGRTYAINAISAVNGGFSVDESGTPSVNQTTWMDYPEEVYTIQPGTGIERTFTVSVPEGTKPGQYVTALALESAEATQIEGSENFKQLIRFAVPVVINVPGPVEPAFEIGDINVETTATGTSFDIEIRNTGNIRVRPAGNVAIFDSSGTQLFSAPVSMGSVFAFDTTSISFSLPQPLAPAEYRIVVTLTDPDTQAKDDAEETISATAPATPAPPAPVQIPLAVGTPRPDADNVQFLDVAATIQNIGDPLTNIRIVLRVTHDGEVVEDFPLAESVALPVGETPFQARYIPATGWSTGTWQFTLSVETLDISTGVAQVLASAPLADLEIS